MPQLEMSESKKIKSSTVGEARHLSTNRTRGGDREFGPESIIVGAQVTKWDDGAAAAGWDSEQIRSCSEGLISLYQCLSKIGLNSGIEKESTEQSLPACPSNGHPGVLDLDKECKTRREKTPTMIWGRAGREGIDAR